MDVLIQSLVWVGMAMAGVTVMILIIYKLGYDEGKKKGYRQGYKQGRKDGKRVRKLKNRETVDLEETMAMWLQAGKLMTDYLTKSKQSS